MAARASRRLSRPAGTTNPSAPTPQFAAPLGGMAASSTAAAAAAASPSKAPAKEPGAPGGLAAAAAVAPVEFGGLWSLVGTGVLGRAGVLDSWETRATPHPSIPLPPPPVSATDDSVFPTSSLEKVVLLEIWTPLVVFRGFLKKL